MDTDELRVLRWGTIGDGYLGPAFHVSFKPGQVLYGSRRTYLRKVALADFSGVCANTTFVIESKDSLVLLPALLPFIMTTEAFHRHSKNESKGSVNPYVNWPDIAKYEFELPPIDEQQRIADVLWAAENARRAAVTQVEALAQARRAWADSTLAKLPAGRTPFKDLWTKSPESGCSAQPSSAPTGHRVLSLAALTDAGYRPDQYKSVEPTDAMMKAVLAQGDLLISRANTVDAVGRAAIYPEATTDVSFPDTMMRVHVDRERVLPQFVVVALMSAEGRLHMRRTAAGTSTSMLKINRQTLGTFHVPVPTLDVQREVLETDSQIALAQRVAALEVEAVSGLIRSVGREVWGAEL